MADAFDALRSDRPYRSAFQPGEAIEILRTLFDKKLDKRFVSILTRIQSKGIVLECLSDWKIDEIKEDLALLQNNEAYKLIFREYPDVVNVEQMCEMLGGISLKTGYGLFRNNEIKHMKIGRMYRIPKLYVSEYVCAANKAI